MQSSCVPILRDRELTLRPAQPEDRRALVGLLRDPQIHLMFGIDAPTSGVFSDADSSAWIEDRIQHPCAWVLNVGCVIGEVRLDRIDYRDRRASLAIGILDAAWLGKQLGRRAIRLVL